MNNIIKRVWNQNRMVNIEDLSGAAFQAEDGGHTFEISGIDDTGAAVALSGTVAGVFRRPDNADIALTGSASGGVASVTLTADCYAVSGRFSLVIFVTSGGQKTAVYACIGTVASTNGGEVAGDTPQDVVDLINAIAAAVATIPASYTNLMAAIAPTYSNTALYAVGAYAWYDGKLYRSIIPITTAEAWTAAHWTAAVLGDDVGDLKSQITYNNIATDNLFSNYVSEWKQGSPSGTEGYISSVKTAYAVDLTKTLYVWSKGLNGFTGFVYLYWFDNSMTYLSNRSIGVGLTRNYVMSDIAPANAVYFKVGVNSGSGSVSVTPMNILSLVDCYVGYSAIEDEASCYARHIPKWSLGAVVEREVIGRTIIDKLGEFKTSENYFSNYAGDWEQGEGNLNSYLSSMKNSFPVLDGFIRLYVDKSSVPTDLLTSGAVYFRIKDDSDTILQTVTRNLSSNSDVRELNILASYPTATKITISITSGNASIPVTPEIASSIKAFIGYKDIGSSITTQYDCDNHNVLQYSRQLVDGGYLPDYWLNYLHDKANDIDTIDETIGGHGFSIAFVTDEHWSNNHQKSPTVLRWLKEHCHVDRFVNGGDLLTGYSSLVTPMLYMREWKTKTNMLKMRNLRGNHDNNSVGTNQQYWLGDGRFYSALVRPVEDDVIVEDGHLYFYEKIEAQKVVIFYLDTGDMVDGTLIDFDAQIAWMDTIVQTLSSDWSILVMQHVVFDGVDGNNNPAFHFTGTKIKTYLDSVTNCNVIGVICGHMHKDYSLTTASGYPLIATTCDASGDQVASGEPTHTEGTTTEQVIDVFQIDTANRKIYATRIGAGNDRNWTY